MNRAQWDERISKIADILYVGEVAVRARREWLDEVGIKRIVSIMTEEQHTIYNAMHPVGTNFFHFTFNFGDGAVISAESMNDILTCIGPEKTLVHCVSGANRSTAVSLCWMISQGWSLVAAYNQYVSTRGLSAAKVYGSVPRMSRQMVINVENWISNNQT